MGQLYQGEGKDRKLLWKKEEELEDGSLKISTVTEDKLLPTDIRKPAMGWNGDLSEGIMYSLAKTFHDLKNGELDKANPQRIKQAKMALHDLLASFIFMWLGSLLMGDKKEFKEKSYPEQYLARVGLKSMNELNVITSLLGSVKVTPAFVEILGGAVTDAQRVFTGDMAFTKAIRDNVRMFEVISPSVIRK